MASDKRIWDEFITDLDRQVFAAAGYGKRIGFGTRPALFVIDVQYNFLGDTPMPILEAVKQYRTACGEEGWKAVPHIKRLLDIARAKNFPVFYSISERRKDHADSGVQRFKNHRHEDGGSVIGSKGVEVPEELVFLEKDTRISKRKPSAFFGTLLMSYLNDLDVDSIVLTGTSTSGCIRATAVDAYSYNFRTVIPEECVFDRFASSHAINLRDLDTKYADVISTDETAALLEALPAREAR